MTATAISARCGFTVGNIPPAITSIICRFRTPTSKCLSVLTIDTAAAPPGLADALGVAHSAGWKRRSNCPCVSAGRSASSSYIFALIPAEIDLIWITAKIYELEADRPALTHGQ